MDAITNLASQKWNCHPAFSLNDIDNAVGLDNEVDVSGIQSEECNLEGIRDCKDYILKNQDLAPPYLLGEGFLAV